MEITFSEPSLCISQSHYISKLLDQFGMTNCREVSTPSDPNVRLSKTEGKDLNTPKVYQELIGSLNYLANSSRPDICFSVAVAPRFCSAPTTAHWTAAKRILRYLKNTKTLCLTFRKNNDEKLIGFSDADYAGDKDTRRSTSGYIFTFAGTPVIWSSRLQKTVALSTFEAEYVSLSSATRDGIWLTQLKAELLQAQTECLTIYCDNQAATSLAINNRSTKMAKHIAIRHHFVAEKCEAGELTVKWCPTSDMLADIMTKPLNCTPFQRLMTKLIQ